MVAALVYGGATFGIVAASGRLGDFTRLSYRAARGRSGATRRLLGIRGLSFSGAECLTRVLFGLGECSRSVGRLGETLSLDRSSRLLALVKVACFGVKRCRATVDVSSEGLGFCLRCVSLLVVSKRIRGTGGVCGQVLLCFPLFSGDFSRVRTAYSCLVRARVRVIVCGRAWGWNWLWRSSVVVDDRRGSGVGRRVLEGWARF